MASLRVFWLGAIAVGLIAVLYAQLIDFGYSLFLRYVNQFPWLPLLITPAVSAACVWITMRLFPGAEGTHTAGHRDTASGQRLSLVNAC